MARWVGPRCAYTAAGAVGRVLAILVATLAVAKYFGVAVQLGRPAAVASPARLHSHVSQRGQGPLGESRTAVVITYTTGDYLQNFQRFVGSLRWSGYSGHIIIGTAIPLAQSTMNYLQLNNVTVRPIEMGRCSHRTSDAKWDAAAQCPHGLPQFKLQWAVYALALGWLQQCTAWPGGCGGGVLIVDFMVTFQDNPFATIPQHDVEVFQEHDSVSTEHWSVDFPVFTCRKVHLKRPMLSSGAVLGTASGVTRFLSALVTEFAAWSRTETCRFPRDDSQAVFNYVVWSNKAKATIVPFGHGKFVALGVLATEILKKEQGAIHMGKRQWLESNVLGRPLTDTYGFILNAKNQRAPIVFQGESFGNAHKVWLEKMVEYVYSSRAPTRINNLPDDVESQSGSPRPKPSPVLSLTQFKPSKEPRNSDALGVYPDHAIEKDDMSAFLRDEAPAVETGCRPLNRNYARFPQFGWPDKVDIFARKAELESKYNAPPIQDNAIKIFIWNDMNPNKHREVGNTIDGVVMHPGYDIVDDMSAADVIFWISTMVRVETEVVPVGCRNVVVLDYSDGCPLHRRRQDLKHKLAYFKRSYVRRNNGVMSGQCGNQPEVLPMAYSGTLRMILPLSTPRTREIVCTLRDGGAFYNVNRGRIIKWTQAFIAKHNVPNSIVNGQITHGSHDTQAGSNNDYTQVINSAKIIVTCNPATWEGDHRLYEALLTGAMVMVDRMDVLPMLPHPLRDKVHVVYYDPHDQQAFERKLMYYYKHPAEARAIAERGYAHTLKHHMPQHRMDYMMSKLPGNFYRPLDNRSIDSD